MSDAVFDIRHSSTGRVLELSGDWSSLTLGNQALELEGELAGPEGETLASCS